MHSARLTVLITGATSGIGLATAHHLASRGFRVFASGRTAQDLASAPSGVEPLVLDVTRKESIEAARAEVDRRTDGRGLDVLVNCAGFAVAGPTELVTTEDLQSQLDVNVLGLMAVTRAFLPAMRSRGSGRVVNIGSLAGRYSFPLLGTYCATKHMVRALTDALRVEVRPFGVDVVLVQPGVVRTNFTARTMTEAQKYVRDDSPYAPMLAYAPALLALSDSTAVEPQVIVKLIERAVTAKRPPPRLTGPWLAGLAVAVLNLLPTRLADALLTRALRLHHLRPPARALPEASHG